MLYPLQAGLKVLRLVVVAVMVGKLQHIIVLLAPPVPFGRTFRPFGREASFRIDFFVGIYYSTIIKIKQVLNG